MKKIPSPRVLILGGTGVFGSRLARMLIEDGRDVTATSRTLTRATAFTKTYGGTPLALERDADLRPVLTGFDILVDAAGPFQNYHGDPYHLARQAVEAGVHYLDLSDDAAFTVGISELDTLAHSQGVACLSGVSSVPAISSAAVTDLAREMDAIRKIETAILPGNRAPRGLSVMQAILGQIGAPLRVMREGKWQELRGWSEPKSYALSPDLKRKAALIGAPDLGLFPSHYSAETVEFRAGLELGVMQYSLAITGWLRTRGLFPNPARFAKPLQWIASWLEPFGSDRGGMVVQVEAQSGMHKSWTLLAEAGDGPFIPAIPSIIAINKLTNGTLPAGARPALDVFTLAEAEQELSRLNVTCTHG